MLLIRREQARDYRYELCFTLNRGNTRKTVGIDAKMYRESTIYNRRLSSDWKYSEVLTINSYVVERYFTVFVQIWAKLVKNLR